MVQCQVEKLRTVSGSERGDTEHETDHAQPVAHGHLPRPCRLAIRCDIATASQTFPNAHPVGQMLKTIQKSENTSKTAPAQPVAQAPETLMLSGGQTLRERCGILLIDQPR